MLVKDKFKTILTTPDPLQRLQVSGLVPGGTPLPPAIVKQEKEFITFQVHRPYKLSYI